MNIHLASSVLALLAVYVASEDNTLYTESGPVQGIEIQTPTFKIVKAYLGIPYAKPPVGNLRFKPPVAITPWTIPLKATKKSMSCIQDANPNTGNVEKNLWFIADNNEVSEDCLTLNIWVPENFQEKAVVMVWIHGGYFMVGTSSSYKFDGQILAAEGNVIVVSLNYRLNIFGFLYLDEKEAPGNMGIMDQALALKWVRDNIHFFGGDPDMVTIFGESAGAVSASHHLLTIPSSRGLFKRVIAQSGTSSAMWALKDASSARSVSNNFSKNAGCSENNESTKEMVKCLRKLDVSSLKKAGGEIVVPGTTLKWTPVLDGNFIPMESVTALKSKKVDENVEVLIGTTTEEGSIFALHHKFITKENNYRITRETFLKSIQHFFNVKNDLIAGIILQFYTDWEYPDDPARLRKELIHFFTDTFILCNTNEISDLLSENGNSVFRYQFRHLSSDNPYSITTSAAHGDDIPFVFGLPLDPKRNFTKEEYYFSKQIIRYWTDFAKYGNPNKESEVEWPQYSKTTRAHLNLGVPIREAFGSDLRYNQCALWLNLLPKFVEFFSIYSY